MPQKPPSEPRAEIRALCVVCGQEAPRLACPSCDAPLCHEHRLLGDERCASCEVARVDPFPDRPGRSMANRFNVISLVVTLVAMMVILHLVDTYGISPAWLLPSVILTGSAPLVVARYRARRAQRLASPSEPLWGLSKEEA